MKMLRILREGGFTLIELLVVVGVFTVIVGVAAPQYATMKRGVALDSEAQILADTLRTAQNRAMTSQDGASHGVHFVDSQYILFSGDTWAGRDVTKDRKFTFDVHIQILTAIPTDVIFQRLSGATSLATVRIGWSGGAHEDILIDSQGRVTIL